MNMANGNSKVLTAEQEMQIRRPIEEYVGASSDNFKPTTHLT